jgi:phosphoglycerate dehydrogenase-like enzyme
MRIHVVETIAFTPAQKARLEKLGEVRYFEGVPDANEFVERSTGADILAVDFSPIDEAIPKMVPGVKLISLPFTGVGWIPLDVATQKGIKIANAPGYSTESVAEFGIGLMVSLVRRIYLYAQSNVSTDMTISLYDKNITVLGAGRIGNHVAKITQAMGMNVKLWKRGENILSAIQEADVVYLALPFSPETKGLLGKKEFSAMKKGSFFVTTSHNQIYDHEELLHALENNLAGAALDAEGTNVGDYNSSVYQKFGKHPKVLVTPHVAFKTDHAINKGRDMLIDNIEAFVKGKPINLVN